MSSVDATILPTKTCHQLPSSPMTVMNIKKRVYLVILLRQTHSFVLTPKLPLRMSISNLAVLFMRLRAFLPRVYHLFAWQFHHKPLYYSSSAAAACAWEGCSSHSPRGQKPYPLSERIPAHIAGFHCPWNKLVSPANTTWTAGKGTGV